MEEFIEYLETTLIPDLKESGRDATAEDFEKCVEYMQSRTVIQDANDHFQVSTESIRFEELAKLTAALRVQLLVDFKISLHPIAETNYLAALGFLEQAERAFHMSWLFQLRENVGTISGMRP